MVTVSFVNKAASSLHKIVVQKYQSKTSISFLKEESIPNIPTKDEILKYYDDNTDKYFVDETFTFTHLFYSSENNSEERAENAYKDIIKGFDVNADPFFLGKNFVNKTLININSDFGKNFGDYCI